MNDVRFTQIATGNNVVVALDNAGSAWVYVGEDWHKMPPHPGTDTVGKPAVEAAVLANADSIAAGMSQVARHLAHMATMDVDAVMRLQGIRACMRTLAAVEAAASVAPGAVQPPGS